MQKNRFSHAAQLTINLLANVLQVAVVLMHKNKVKQGNKGYIVRGIARKVLSIFKTILE